ncbi:MAG: FliM/FliN family flagellar motor switch protein [Verrucomicrobiota bacterium]
MAQDSEQSGFGDILSQSEVEQLLAQVVQQESHLPDQERVREAESQSSEGVRIHDFRRPAFLSSGQLRKLRLHHEEIVRSLAACLSIYLRLEFSLEMVQLQTIAHQQFAENLLNPTHLTLFKIEPLRGIGILDLHPRLGLSLVDRLLGGGAHSTPPAHDLSEIEVTLLDQAVQIILGEWCNHWSQAHDLRPLILGHEASGHFLQTDAHDTIMLVVTMKARLGDCSEQMQIAIPCYTLETLLRQLRQNLESSAPGQAASAPAESPKWNESFSDILIPLTAEWSGLELRARDLSRLKVGDVLELDPQSVNQVQVRLGELPKFAGRLGTCGRKWAVELTQVHTRS